MSTPTKSSEEPTEIWDDPVFVRGFLSRCKKLDGDDNCWVWTGAKNGASKDGKPRPKSCGYGVVWVKERGERKQLLAHRVAWEIANKERIPEKLLVMHECDNPPCCNPKHLRTGTHAENNQDAIDKGRKSACGEKNPGSKLTKEQVQQIYRLREAGQKYRDIAARFDVTRDTIGRIARGETWKEEFTESSESR